MVNARFAKMIRSLQKLNELAALFCGIIAIVLAALMICVMMRFIDAA